MTAIAKWMHWNSECHNLATNTALTAKKRQHCGDGLLKWAAIVDETIIGSFKVNEKNS